MDQVEVLGVETRTGLYAPGHKKAGQQWSMTMAQVVVTRGDGRRIVGELAIPKDHPEVKPGFYQPSFKLTQYSGKIEAAIDTLAPVKSGAAVKAA